jgi:hypothetical protein
MFIIFILCEKRMSEKFSDLDYLVWLSTCTLVVCMFSFTTYFRSLTTVQNYILTMLLRLALWISWSLYLISYQTIDDKLAWLYITANMFMLFAVFSNAMTNRIWQGTATLQEAKITAKITPVMFASAACCVMADALSSSPVHREALYFFVVLCASALHGTTGGDVYALFRRLARAVVPRNLRRIRPHTGKRKIE